MGCRFFPGVLFLSVDLFENEVWIPFLVFSDLVLELPSADDVRSSYISPWIAVYAIVWHVDSLSADLKHHLMSDGHYVFFLLLFLLQDVTCPCQLMIYFWHKLRKKGF